MMVGYIEKYGERFGVEPICAVLPITPSTYYAHRARKRKPARRGMREPDQHDGVGSTTGEYPESGESDVRRVAAECLVGCGFDLHRDLAPAGLRGVRDRRVFSTNRGLAGIELAAHRSGPRCA